MEAQWANVGFSKKPESLRNEPQPKPPRALVELASFCFLFADPAIVTKCVGASAFCDSRPNKDF